MAKSAKISEILQRRSRQRTSVSWLDVDMLQREWREGGAGIVLQQFIPVRLTSCIEVAVRNIIEEMIDRGGEYLIRGLKLLNDRGVKDITDAMVAIHQDRLTIGTLVSHTISTNSVDGIVSALTLVYGDQFKVDLSKSHDRAATELDGLPQKPIIEDLDHTFKRLTRILEVRHIIVHEAPFVPPYEEEELKDYFKAAREFLSALWWTVGTKLEGNFPLKQGDINESIGAGLKKTEEELKKVLDTLSLQGDYEQILKSQSLWEAYAEHEAQLQAGYLSGLPIHSSAAGDYYGAKSLLTHERLQHLLGKSQAK